jgi:hypothetical protein
VMEAGQCRRVHRQPGGGGWAASMGPKAAAALGTGVQARVVVAEVLMWRPRRWRAGRVVLIAGRGGGRSAAPRRWGRRVVSSMGGR